MQTFQLTATQQNDLLSVAVQNDLFLNRLNKSLQSDEVSGRVYSLLPLLIQVNTGLTPDCAGYETAFDLYCYEVEKGTEGATVEDLVGIIEAEWSNFEGVRNG